MRIKQKFFLLAGIIGIVMIIVSAIGYKTAADSVDEATRKELMANIAVCKVFGGYAVKNS